MRRYAPHFIILVGLIARLVLSPHQGHRGDEEAFGLWLGQLMDCGLADFYSESECNYPPIWPYILWLMGHGAKALGLSLVAGDPLYRVMLKLPQILADVAICYLVWWQFLRSMSRRAELAWCAFIALNPALIFISAIWCQTGPLLALAIVGTVVAYARERPAVAVSCAALSILVKPLALPVIPVLLVAVWRKHGPPATLWAIACAAVVTVAVMLPMNVHQPATLLVDLCTKTADWFGYSSLNAFNVWSFTGFFESHHRVALGLPHVVWGMLLFGAAYVLTLLLVWRRHDLTGLLAGLALAQLAFFLLPTMIHERYIHLPVVLVLLWAVQDAWVIPGALILAVTATLNFHYRVRVPGIELLGRLQDAGIVAVVCSIANLAVFVYLGTVARRRSCASE